MPRSTAGHQAPVYLLVCGSPELSDGAAGPTAAAAALADLRAAGAGSRVRVIRCLAPQLGHLLAVPTGSALVIADAAIGGRPGEIVRRTLDELIDDPNGPRPSSAVAAPIDQLLGMANVIGEQPLSGFFVGVVGEQFGPRRGLSPAVRAALRDYAAALAEVVAGLAGKNPSAEALAIAAR